MLTKYLLLCLCYLTTVLCVHARSDFVKREAEIALRLIELSKNETFSRLFHDQFADEHEGKKLPYDCEIIPPSAKTPTSVHQLRPGDIKVVSSLGDSITAGRGASGGVVGLLLDFRGLSWSDGGHGSFENTRTLPNILRLYNPSVYGSSTGLGDRDSHHSSLNVAKSGDESRHMPEQAKILVERLQNDHKVNFTNDWKLITIFIGGNDLCGYCEDEELYSVENYKTNLQTALDYLHDKVPRALVNLVEVNNIEIVEELANNVLCELIHLYVCDCAANPKNAEAEKKLIDAKFGYQKAARDIAASGRYDTKDDFTVVLQPFYQETYLPKTKDGKIDYSYFASDCFHYSKKGQEVASEALWNNMVEPVGSKRVAWTPGEKLECPTESSPYIYTNKNSPGAKRAGVK